MEPRGDRWSHAPPIPKPNGQRMTPPMRHAWWELGKGKRGKGRKEKIEIVAEIEGRNWASVTRTETIPKAEWQAHDSTGRRAGWELGKREAREEMEREDRNSGGDRRKDGFGG